MNLIEQNFQTKEQKKKKKLSAIILGIIIVLIIAIIAIASYLVYIQSTTLKVSLNGQQSEKLRNLLEKYNDFDNLGDGTVYVPIKEIAGYLGYESYNGEYSDKSESNSKCYVQSQNEVANFELNSNKIYKLDFSKSNKNYEYVYIRKPIKASGGILCASTEAIEKAFNVSFQYDADKNRIDIYTIPYLIEAYSPRVLDYGYTKISETFDNQKAILQNMLVVEKGDSNKICGVIDTTGNSILEAKYDEITYLPNIGDFLIKTNGKYGIMSNKGKTKIDIMYDSIELMDSDSGLYVVKKDNKYGVLDLEGKTKIYIENDEIGMDISKFSQNDIKNKYILAENLIPARRDKLWGLYDKNGNLVVDFQYDSFGYVATTNKDALSLLVIPNYNVLVACKDKKYTLLNSVGEELFAGPVADDIYMTISGGQKYYYIAANNMIMEAKDYFEQIGITEKNQTINNNSNEENTETNNDQEQDNQEEQQENQQENEQEQQYEENNE